MRGNGEDTGRIRVLLKVLKMPPPGQTRDIPPLVRKSEFQVPDPKPYIIYPIP